ncbi:trypsin-like peptidase domain-containing protein [Brevundimonas vesicularis]|uniref:trypsin-like peptidase domain-containing protein n=1 Tax=Brevundimonas vesicularis TaxID=41276 RepID=UPI0038D3C33E
MKPTGILATRNPALTVALMGLSVLGVSALSAGDAGAKVVPHQVQAATAQGLPYDAQRGVFTFASGLDDSLPAVVQITTLGQSRGPASDTNPKPSQGGSGVIIDAARGIIVTNHHVIENGQKFTVDLIDGRLFDAVLVGSDKATDIAVLKIEAERLAQVETVDSDTLRTGDLAFAVGYPMGLDQTLTMGVISGLNRSGMGDAIEDYIQTDAAVNQGNSGGPLLDSRGRLIGINTAILSGGFGGGNDGIAFAVPTRIMQFVVDQLMASGEVKRGQIGASLGSLTAERARELGLKIVRGAIVHDVMPGSPAEQAGLARGDIITGIDSRPVSNAGSVQATVGIAGPGTRMPVTYLRQGHEGQATVEIQIRAPGQLHLGRDSLTARGLTARAHDRGAQVAVVEGGTSASRAGLQAGDVITRAGGQPVQNLQGLARSLSGTGTVELLVLRESETVTLSLES